MSLKGRGAATNEGYTERGINTFNDLPKDKSTQTGRILHRDAEAFATVWDLHDNFTALQGALSPYMRPSFPTGPYYGMAQSVRLSVRPVRAHHTSTGGHRHFKFGRNILPRIFGKVTQRFFIFSYFSFFFLFWVVRWTKLT